MLPASRTWHKRFNTSLNLPRKMSSCFQRRSHRPPPPPPACAPVVEESSTCWFPVNHTTPKVSTNCCVISQNPFCPACVNFSFISPLFERRNRHLLTGTTCKSVVSSKSDDSEGERAAYTVPSFTPSATRISHGSDRKGNSQVGWTCVCVCVCVCVCFGSQRATCGKPDFQAFGCCNCERLVPSSFWRQV